MDLSGSVLPRSGTDNVVDIYLTGTFTFSLPCRTDTFEVDLRGTRVRSVFALRQSDGGASPIVVEIEGIWLEETDYVACGGRLAVPVSDAAAQPYIFMLRTADREVPARDWGETWVDNLEYLASRATMMYDNMAETFEAMGSSVKETVERSRLWSVAIRLSSLARDYFI
jgi:hypothetical protein